MTSFDGLRALMRLIDSIAEADYFLDQLRRRVGHDDARFLFRAFLAATRNIGPTLETLMRDEPAFAAWYSTQRGSVGEEVLGDLVSTPRLVDRPESNVWLLCASHLRDLLTTVRTCFRRFDVEPSARALFTRETLSAWQHSIEDRRGRAGLSTRLDRCLPRSRGPDRRATESARDGDARRRPRVALVEVRDRVRGRSDLDSPDMTVCTPLDFSHGSCLRDPQHRGTHRSAPRPPRHRPRGRGVQH